MLSTHRSEIPEPSTDLQVRFNAKRIPECPGADSPLDRSVFAACDVVGNTKYLYFAVEVRIPKTKK